VALLHLTQVKMSIRKIARVFAIFEWIAFRIADVLEVGYD